MDERVYGFLAGVGGCEVNSTVNAAALTARCDNVPEGTRTFFAKGANGKAHNWALNARW